jgi:hypothetical protein
MLPPLELQLPTRQGSKFAGSRSELLDRDQTALRWAEKSGATEPYFPTCCPPPPPIKIHNHLHRPAHPTFRYITGC